jgi:hypothetical protein
MFSPQYIRELSRKAAAKSVRQKKLPYTVWPEDLVEWKAKLGEGKTPTLPFPFIGDRNPRGYKKLKEFFVDSSGFGLESEPALTVRSFVDKLQANRAYAITEVGQFQVYVAEFLKTKKG